MVRDVATASHGREGRTAEDAGKERGKGRNLREMILTTGTSLGEQAGNKKRAHRRGRRGRRGRTRKGAESSRDDPHDRDELGSAGRKQEKSAPQRTRRTQGKNEGRDRSGGGRTCRPRGGRVGKPERRRERAEDDEEGAGERRAEGQ